MKRKLNTTTMALVVLAIHLGFAAEAYCYTKSINTPHRLQQTKYWCGAASAQMILECNTVAPDRSPAYPTGTITQIQQGLYNHIQANNSPPTFWPGWATDPDGLEATLDHFDADPGRVYVQFTSTDAAWSCKKLAWTLEHYEVPPAVLIYEGGHWVVVVAVETSKAPTATGTYTIKSFTVHDPWQWKDALGANKKIGYNNFTCKYFTDVNTPTGDPWRGLRVSVCDPDPVSEDLIAPPPLQEGPLISPDEALEAAAAAIDEYHLWADPGFEGALGDAEPLTPVLAKWPFCGAGPCYCIPYAKMGEERRLLTVVIVVHGASGEFMEASYAADESAPAVADLYNELTYPFIARESSARPGLAIPAATVMAIPITLPAPAPPPIKINFQPADAVVPYGCLADFGDLFGDRGNGYSYGWNAPNYETRDRDAHLDQRYDTLIHMQKPSNPHAVWEIELENGIYNVLLICGDPSYQDQINNVNVNHCMFHPVDPDPWDGVSDSAGSDFDVYQGTVTVTEGRLGIEPDEGAVNMKICYVKITPAPEPICPEELLGTDIGEPLPPGSIDLCAGSCRWAITAGGADIWGTADQFYYAYAAESLHDDFTAVVRVKSMGPPGSNGWSKAGIMVRETLEPGSRHAMVVRTPENGIALQGREVPDGESWNQPVGGDYGPDDHVWLRLDRAGNTITGSYAIGGETPPEVWMGSASQLVEWDAGPQHIGLATTSHEQGVPVEVAYSNFCIGPYVGPPVLKDPVLPDSPAGGEGYLGIREVIDNGEINDQAACYASLASGEGTIVDYTAPVLNIQDSDSNGRFGNDDVFGVVTTGHREKGSVDHISLIVRGTIRIPRGQGGEYTFGVNSDDGFTLQFPGQNFLIGENGRIVNFESGAALQFYGGRGAADTMGVINLPAGDHSFWLTYHEGGSGASVEMYAAKGKFPTIVEFDPKLLKLVGFKSPDDVPIPGICNEFNMIASEPGAWSHGQILNLQNGLDALAEGDVHGTNSVGVYSIVNHSDPDDGANDPHWSGSKYGDLVFPNDNPGDDDDFGVKVTGEIDIPAAGMYQIGFNSDDGASLQVHGYAWTGIVSGSNAAAVIVGDQLITDALTGWSWTAGEIHFPHAGCYEFTALMFERSGGSFFELFGRGVSPSTGQPGLTWHVLEVGGAKAMYSEDGLQLVAHPVAYWKFDDEGIIAADWSGYGHDLRLIGDPCRESSVALPWPIPGAAIKFDGIDDYGDGGTFNPSVRTGEITVAVWAKWNGLTSQWQGLVGKRDTWAAHDMMWQVECDRDTGVVRAQREGIADIRDPSFVLEIGQWEHVAFTFDGSIGTLYRNGEAVASGPYSFGSDIEAAVVVGACEANGGNPFNGALADVRIYDRGLSPAEIADLVDPVECFPDCHPDHDEWVAVGKPLCWCYPTQCHGDADGEVGGSEKTGQYHVGPPDLAVLIDSWLVKEPPHGQGIDSVPNGICADFAHDQGGSEKTGVYRVGPTDLNILIGNWLKKQPPHGEGVEFDCLACEDEEDVIISGTSYEYEALGDVRIQFPARLGGHTIMTSLVSRPVLFIEDTPAEPTEARVWVSNTAYEVGGINFLYDLNGDGDPEPLETGPFVLARLGPSMISPQPPGRVNLTTGEYDVTVIVYIELPIPEEAGIGDLGFLVENEHGLIDPETGITQVASRTLTVQSDFFEGTELTYLPGEEAGGEAQIACASGRPVMPPGKRRKAVLLPKQYCTEKKNKYGDFDACKYGKYVPEYGWYAEVTGVGVRRWDYYYEAWVRHPGSTKPSWKKYPKYYWGWNSYYNGARVKGWWEMELWKTQKCWQFPSHTMIEIEMKN